MSTTIHPEVSEKNKYWIDKHRYYELKHFCLQYPLWKKEYQAFDGYGKQPVGSEVVTNNNRSDPTAKCAENREYYLDRIKIIEQTAIKTDSIIGNYILTGVTEGISYNVLKLKYDVPCCRDTYYNLYRRFFWLLSQERR